ncbi:hypothetical protein ACFXDO_24220 [Streptomyces nigra]|uniref:hypothetical protein n=1 Tax=Streptomyces nigra TaxID=1827580 RepID=UPI0036984DD2
MEPSSSAPNRLRPRLPTTTRDAAHDSISSTGETVAHLLPAVRQSLLIVGIGALAFDV